MSFGATVQDGVRAHQAQLRARQARVRHGRSQSALPRLANDLTMSGDQGSIPLQSKKPAPPKPGLKVLDPSSIGVTNAYVRGNLHTPVGADKPDVTTTDLTIGSDFRVSEDLMIGAAAGGLGNAEAGGATVSAYVTTQPLEKVFVDMSMSYGAHHSRSKWARSATGSASDALDGTSRALSISLNTPRQIGEWHWSPYSRYDRVVTDVAARAASAAAATASYDLSAMALGSTAATTWTTPFGPVQPMVMVEIQREVVTVAGIGTTASQTQGVVGFGMTTKVSRDMSAFAESRYASDLAATLDRQMTMGVKFAF